MPETYAHDDVVTFRVGKAASPESQALSPVTVPAPLMYRLYHLARAYDLRSIIPLHPTSGTVLIPYVCVQTLGLELELLSSIIDDPAIDQCVTQLLELISNTRNDTKFSLLADL